MKNIFISCMLFISVLCSGQTMIGDDDLSEIWKCNPDTTIEVEDDYYYPDFKAGLLYYKILELYSDTLVEVYPPQCECANDKNYSQLDTIVIPEKVIYKEKIYTVKGIGWGAFDGCKNLKKVVLPNTVTYIARYAFDGCDSIMSINIPSSLKRIGPPSWELNSYMEDVYKQLPDSIEYVPYGLGINPW